MKFTVHKIEIEKAVNAVKGAVGSPVSNPIVENILIGLDGSKAWTRATNLNQTVQREMEIQDSDGAGEIAVPAGRFTSLTKDLPDADITFESKDHVLYIECQDFKGKIKGFDAEVFPPIESIKDAPSITLDAKWFLGAIKRCFIATTQDKSRFELDGILFIIDSVNQSGVMVATDGRRLSRVEWEQSCNSDIRVMISTKTWSLLMNAMVGVDSVDIRFGNRKTEFIANKTIILSNNLAENFPDYKKIVPQKGDLTVTVDRKSLAQSVGRVSHFTDKLTEKIMFNIFEDSICIAADCDEVGSDGSDYIDADVSGFKEYCVARYNYRLILDLLRVAEEGPILFNYSETDKPVLITEKDNEWFTHVIMPLRVQNN